MSWTDDCVTITTLCDCHSDEHTLRWEFWKDQQHGCSELTCHVFLNNDFVGWHPPTWLPEFIYNLYYTFACLFIFARRIKTAIKYVFGYKCKYGHFDCFTFDPNDVDRMIEYLNLFKAERARTSTNGSQEIEDKLNEIYGKMTEEEKKEDLDYLHNINVAMAGKLDKYETKESSKK